MLTNRKYNTTLGPFFENFIIISIILVLILTILDEISVIYLWPLSTHRILLITGFLFDLIFTIEFFVRLQISYSNNGLVHYIKHERGWVDFISSVPLLLLNSGPEMAMMIFPDMLHGNDATLAYLGTLKIVKAVRVTRILRLLRMIKILGKIQNTESTMANRHMAVISTTTTVSIIIIYALLSIIQFTGLQEIESSKARLYSEQINNIFYNKDNKINIEDYTKKDIKNFITTLYFRPGVENSDIVSIYYQSELIMSNYTESYLTNHFNYHPEKTPLLKFMDANILSFQYEDFILTLNLHDIQAEKAKLNILIFILALSTILSLLFIYSRHFVQNISDVVHVIKKGMEDDKYMFSVRINEAFENDEIFELAKEYNKNYLPEKAVQNDNKESTNTGGLTIDNFF